jgi:hypothetical protein
MTDKQTPPDWVLREAAKRGAFRSAAISEMRMWYQADKTFRALCDMIQKYEQPPVDRKLLCAREAITQSHDITFGSNIQHWQWIATSAIKLWEEGFGK